MNMKQYGEHTFLCGLTNIKNEGKKMCQKTQQQAKTENEKVLFRLSRKHCLKTLGKERNQLQDLGPVV